MEQFEIQQGVSPTSRPLPEGVEMQAPERSDVTAREAAQLLQRSLETLIESIPMSAGAQESAERLIQDIVATLEATDGITPGQVMAAHYDALKAERPAVPENIVAQKVALDVIKSTAEELVGEDKFRDLRGTSMQNQRSR